MRRLAGVGIVGTLLLSGPHAALGQCVPEWSDLFGSGDPGPVYAIAELDPDGAGPLGVQLLVGGNESLVSAGNGTRGLHRWGGRGWKGFGAGLEGFGNTLQVHAAAIFDPDDAGPAGELLYVGGSFQTAGGTVSPYLAVWDGQQWMPPPGGGPNYTVRVLRVVDLDGPGPQESELWVGGGFGQVNGESMHGAARWDGQNWAAAPGLVVQVSSDAGVCAIETNDPDGPGPLPLALYAAGEFAQVGTGADGGVAHWDGSQFVPTGHTDTRVFALAPYDADGDGPDPSRLYAGGSLGLFRLNTSWIQVAGISSNDDILALHAHDPDGAGPGAPLLAIGGDFTSLGGVPSNCFVQYNGSELLTQAGVIPLNSTSAVRSISQADPDGGGPEPRRLFLGGTFSTSGYRNIAYHNGSGWIALGREINGDVLTLLGTTEAELDGRLYLGGKFTRIGSLSASRIAAWDGQQFQALAGGIGGFSQASVNSLVVFDDDGTGPSAPALFAGGSFSTAGTATVSGVARWDGQEWTNVGGGLTGVVRGLAVFDNDGPGPNTPVLYACGRFQDAGGGSIHGLARFDQGVWILTGPTLSGSQLIATMAAWDKDGGGPQMPVLVLANRESNAPALEWDGTNWAAFGPAVQGSIYTFHVHDSDGVGPGSPTLYVGGAFTQAGLQIVRYIARWTSGGWMSVGTGIENGTSWSVHAIRSHDEDGPGSAPAALFVGGEFTSAGSELAPYLARWNGDWRGVGGGMGYTSPASVFALTVHDDDGVGPESPSLFAGGAFSAAGNTSSSKLAKWVCVGVPCYANCDGSVIEPILNVADFSCFLQRFASGHPYANCDQSSIEPIINVADFTCFLNRFAAGCR